MNVKSLAQYCTKKCTSQHCSKAGYEFTSSSFQLLHVPKNKHGNDHVCPRSKKKKQPGSAQVTGSQVVFLGSFMLNFKELGGMLRAVCQRQSWFFWLPQPPPLGRWGHGEIPRGSQNCSKEPEIIPIPHAHPHDTLFSELCCFCQFLSPSQHFLPGVTEISLGGQN